ATAPSAVKLGGCGSNLDNPAITINVKIKIQFPFFITLNLWQK
ncbi:MAG: hypothetical protein ACJAUJ_001467, partial [Salibacteraceae bacterium]